MRFQNKMEQALLEKHYNFLVSLGLQNSFPNGKMPQSWKEMCAKDWNNKENGFFDPIAQDYVTDREDTVRLSDGYCYSKSNLQYMHNETSQGMAKLPRSFQEAKSTDYKIVGVQPLNPQEIESRTVNTFADVGEQWREDAENVNLTEEQELKNRFKLFMEGKGVFRTEFWQIIGENEIINMFNKLKTQQKTDRVKATYEMICILLNFSKNTKEEIYVINFILILSEAKVYLDDFLFYESDTESMEKYANDSKLSCFAPRNFTNNYYFQILWIIAWKYNLPTGMPIYNVYSYSNNRVFVDDLLRLFILSVARNEPNWWSNSNLVPTEIKRTILRYKLEPTKQDEIFEKLVDQVTSLMSKDRNFMKWFLKGPQLPH